MSTLQRLGRNPQQKAKMKDEIDHEDKNKLGQVVPQLRSLSIAVGDIMDEYTAALEAPVPDDIIHQELVKRAYRKDTSAAQIQGCSAYTALAGKEMSLKDVITESPNADQSFLIVLIVRSLTNRAH